MTLALYTWTPESHGQRALAVAEESEDRAKAAVDEFVRRARLDARETDYYRDWGDQGRYLLEVHPVGVVASFDND